MFGQLLGGKFSNKCKHAFKCIKSRIGLIRRKKQAMLKYLKNDVAELLSNGHDTNAFGRIGSLIVEINHASCYDMIEQYCECILQQLPSLRKQRECPEEAMEAMSTLIFAAARFSDLPELCDLRIVFTERYGSQMESSISREFVDKVQKKKFSTEKKIQLMQYIADEFSVSWDSKAFLHKLSNPSAARASDQPKRLSEAGRKEAVIHVVPSTSPAKKEQTQPRPRDIHVVPSINNGRQGHDPSAKNTKKMHAAAAAEGPENSEPHCKDAPMTKDVCPRTELEGVKNGDCATTEGGLNSTGLINRMPPYTKPKIKNPSAGDDGIMLADVPTDGDVLNGTARPKPFSVRKKHSADEAKTTSRVTDGRPHRDHTSDETSMKQQPRQAEVADLGGGGGGGGGGGVYERHASRHRRDQTKHRSERYAANDGDRDEEEEAMDRLLVHYSRKGMSKVSARAPPRELVADGTVRAAVPAELVRRRLDRIASLPSEPTTPVAEVGAGKRHARAASMSSPKGGVVHPRLPDYDELAARFIALRKS